MEPKEFTIEAELLWRSIPPEVRESISIAVWCAKCGRAAPLCEYYGEVIKGKLVLKGRCGFCCRRVNRTVEISPSHISN
jgi:hypothetical protein